MQSIFKVEVISRPGYFGKDRQEIESRLNKEFGNTWRECWEVEGKILDFNEAILLYDDAYYEYLKGMNLSFLDWITSFQECYDNAIENIRCGINHDAKTCPRHLQDVSVRRALIRLGTYFKDYKGPDETLYDEKSLLHIRGKDTNGHILMPGNVPFHFSKYINQSIALRPWVVPGSVEAFWQANKVIIIPK